MHLSSDKKYKVIHDDKEYFGTPEKIVEDMSWWDRSRPDDHPAYVKNNSEYIKLVSDRLNVMGEENDSLNNECDLLSFLHEHKLILIKESN